MGRSNEPLLGTMPGDSLGGGSFQLFAVTVPANVTHGADVWCRMKKKPFFLVMELRGPWLIRYSGFWELRHDLMIKKWKRWWRQRWYSCWRIGPGGKPGDANKNSGRVMSLTSMNLKIAQGSVKGRGWPVWKRHWRAARPLTHIQAQDRGPERDKASAWGILTTSLCFQGAYALKN